MKTMYKNIARALLMLAASVSILGACTKDQDPYATAGENDAPRILNSNLQDPKEGQPYGLPTIHRDENFKFDLIVTPSEYTAVEWFFDDEKVFDGCNIDMPVLSGDYSVRILATTTKGLTTERNCSLSVLPLDGDPALAGDPKSRWLTIGEKKSIALSNVPGVARFFIGRTEVSGVVFEDGKITFEVPQIEEKDYQLSIETSDGKSFGLGKGTVSSEKYVDPGVKENIIWEGSVDINWGDSNLQITADMLEPYEGKQVYVYYEIIEAEYHALRITNTDWSYDLVPQVDGLDGYESPWVFEYTAGHKAAVDAKGAMLITGFGYRVTKVAVIENAAPAESTLWEGGTEINWGDSNVQIASDQLESCAGKQICVYFEITEAEYHALRITNTDWSYDLVPQIDGLEGKESPLVFEYTAEHKASVDEKGAMLITGFGYKLVKVTCR